MVNVLLATVNDNSPLAALYVAPVGVKRVPRITSSGYLCFIWYTTSFLMKSELFAIRFAAS